MLRKIVRRSASAPSQSQCLQFGFTQEAVPQEETCFFFQSVFAHVLESMVSSPWPRMPNSLLLGHGRCVLCCGCRLPCEAGLSSASSSLHRCMVGPRSMLPCLEACLQGDQATSTPGGSRRKSQKEPGGQQETEGARISYFWGRILARFLSLFWRNHSGTQGGQEITIPF